MKGGAHLESLGVVTVMAFDKTGTLTEGRPRLTDVLPAEGTSSAELLRISVAVERRSDHPLAAAIVDGGTARLPPGDTTPDVADVQAIVGLGIRARVGNEEVLVGSARLIGRAIDLPSSVKADVAQLESQGRTTMVVLAGIRVLGVLGVMDTPRAAAREVIDKLRRMGVERTIMLTGDNQAVADAVARQVGIQEAHGGLLPEDKVDLVARIARSGAPVAMVGDGVNDAPAMASSTVGVAMGAGGSDVALETADVALMADDVSGLPFAVGLSRAARRVIRQNLWASLGMVAFLVPATIAGWAGIGLAVALHEGSTLVVVANALRLLAYRDERAT